MWVSSCVSSALLPSNAQQNLLGSGAHERDVTAPWRTPRGCEPLNHPVPLSADIPLYGCLIKVLVMSHERYMLRFRCQILVLVCCVATPTRSRDPAHGEPTAAARTREERIPGKSSQSTSRVGLRLFHSSSGRSADRDS